MQDNGSSINPNQNANNSTSEATSFQNKTDIDAKTPLNDAEIAKRITVDLSSQNPDLYKKAPNVEAIPSSIINIYYASQDWKNSRSLSNKEKRDAISRLTPLLEALDQASHKIKDTEYQVKHFLEINTNLSPNSMHAIGNVLSFIYEMRRLQKQMSQILLFKKPKEESSKFDESIEKTFDNFYNVIQIYGDQIIASIGQIVRQCPDIMEWLHCFDFVEYVSRSQVATEPKLATGASDRAIRLKAIESRSPRDNKSSVSSNNTDEDDTLWDNSYDLNDETTRIQNYITTIDKKYQDYIKALKYELRVRDTIISRLTKELSLAQIAARATDSFSTTTDQEGSAAIQQRSESEATKQNNIVYNDLNRDQFTKLRELMQSIEPYLQKPMEKHTDGLPLVNFGNLVKILQYDQDQLSLEGGLKNKDNAQQQYSKAELVMNAEKNIKQREFDRWMVYPRITVVQHKSTHSGSSYSTTSNGRNDGASSYTSQSSQGTSSSDSPITYVVLKDLPLNRLPKRYIERLINAIDPRLKKVNGVDIATYERIINGYLAEKYVSSEQVFAAAREPNNHAVMFPELNQRIKDNETNQLLLQAVLKNCSPRWVAWARYLEIQSEQLESMLIRIIQEKGMAVPNPNATDNASTIVDAKNARLILIPPNQNGFKEVSFKQIAQEMLNKVEPAEDRLVPYKQYGVFVDRTRYSYATRQGDKCEKINKKQKEVLLHRPELPDNFVPLEFRDNSLKYHDWQAAYLLNVDRHNKGIPLIPITRTLDPKITPPVISEYHKAYISMTYEPTHIDWHKEAARVAKLDPESMKEEHRQQQANRIRPASQHNLTSTQDATILEFNNGSTYQEAYLAAGRRSNANSNMRS